MAPVLTVIADTVGIIGGWLIAVFQLRVASSVYWTSVVDGLYIEDAWMGLIKPFFLGFVIVTIGCHVGLRTTRRHAGRRPRDDQRRRRRVGGGDRRRLLRDAAADHAAVLMAIAVATNASPELEEALGPELAGRRVRQGVAGLRREGDPARRQLHAAHGPHEDHPGRQRRREVDDPQADSRPAASPTPASSGSTASASTR